MITYLGLYLVKISLLTNTCTVQKQLNSIFISCPEKNFIIYTPKSDEGEVLADFHKLNINGINIGSVEFIHKDIQDSFSKK